MQGVGQGLLPKGVGRPEVTSIPAADVFAHLWLGNLERQKAARPDGCLDVVDVDERGRAAKIAALGDMLRIEDADGIAALAAHGTLLRRPTPLIVRQGPQCGDEVVFLDEAPVRLEFGGALGPAIGADESLLSGIPNRFGSAGGTVVLLDGCDLGHGQGNGCDSERRVKWPYSLLSERWRSAKNWR